MKFIDQVDIIVESGSGGPGCVSFRKEKFLERGGPNGGDGGRGGDLVFKVNPGLNTLLHISKKRHYKAEKGESGGSNNSTGASGEDLIIEVPEGTLVKSESGKILLDLCNPEEMVVFLKGGRGGKGNNFFKSSINQAPKHAQPGEPSEKQSIKLELKLMADVGLLGYPNVGKSTLISVLSSARPRIADYPFTTLTPSLGMVEISEEKSFVLADIPGLIPGASEGVGLGIQFLRHIERTKCFLHLIDASPYSGRDPWQDYLDIQKELEIYDKKNSGKDGFFSLLERKQIVVLNKIDTMKEENIELIENQFAKEGIETLSISAVSKHGLKEIKYKLGIMLFGDKDE